MRYLASIALAAALAVMGVTTAHAATVQCNAIPNGGCSSWETPGGGGFDLDVYRQSTAPDTPLIVYTATGSDPAEDIEIIPVPASSVSIYTYAGSQAPTTQAYVNIEYAPKGQPSGMCVSDIAPSAGQPDELRPCNTVPGKYNPFQSFTESASDVGDGIFVSFEDAPTSPEGTASGLYLSDLRPQAGDGRAGHRVDAGSDPEPTGGLAGGQLWAAVTG
jgi:hypothetical protein